MRIEVQNNVINKEVLERNKKYLMPTWKNYLARIYITFFLVLSIICLILSIPPIEDHSLR